MAIIVNTNMSALKTQGNLTNATNSLSSSLERMSTGYKINSAKDDAAGLYVATGLTTQIRGSKIALSNVSTGSNVLNTVEGDLDTMLDNLNRIRDLANQAANGIYDEDAQNAMLSEVNARLAEIDRVSASSNFNGLKLLDGSNTELKDNGLRLQVGANADADANAIYVTGVFDQIDSTTLGKDNGDDTFDAMSLKEAAKTAFSAASTAARYLKVVDKAIDTISVNKSKIGAAENRLESAQASLITTIENATAAHSTIMDADIAEESAEYTKSRILQQTSASLLVQANALPSLALSLISS